MDGWVGAVLVYQEWLAVFTLSGRITTSPSSNTMGGTEWGVSWIGARLWAVHAVGVGMKAAKIGNESGFVRG